MTTVIDGADITIRVDTARVAFVLDIHKLDYPESVLTPELDVLADVTCDVLSALWTWGASEWAGPFTIAEAGNCQVVLRDPDRLFDPANDAITPPIPGRLLQILVDDAPAFTGHVSDISHSLAAGETVIMGHDAIALLSGTAFTSLSPEGSTLDQFTWALQRIGWPPAERVTYGIPAAWRELGPEVETAWPALLRIARAELGTVWADRSNRVAFRARGIDEPPPAILPVIGCEGADVADVMSLLERKVVVNHVLVESGEGIIALEYPDTESIGIFESGARAQSAMTCAWASSPVTAPGKPTLVTPVGPDADARTFLLHGASVPALNGWAIQVSSNVNVPAGHIYWDSRGTTGFTAGKFTVTVPYAGETLPGSPTWLYWRAAIRNADAWGPWSMVGKFSADLTLPATRDPYDEWARAVLSAMARPRVALVPGTIHPRGAHVRELVTADLGTRWRLSLPDVTPPVYADLAVAGMTVECNADTGWAISAITGHVDSQGHSGDYLARAIALGPLGHWRLSDPTGAFRAPYVGTVDLTPGGGGAQYVDASPWGPVWADQPDGCIGFGGGATAWLDGGDVYDFAGTAPFSFACWVNPTAIDTGQRRIVGKESTSGYLVWLREDAAGITRYDTGGQDQATAPGPIVLGAGWRHLVATYDGTNLRCYLDGNPGAPVASGRALPGHASPFYVGRWSSVDTQYQLIGHLDELSVFGRALTPAEVSTLYGGGLTP